MTKSIVYVLALTLIGICIATGMACSDERAATPPSTEASLEGIRPTLPKRIKLGVMGPDEKELFLEYLKMAKKWREGVVTAKEINGLLGLDERKIECRLTIPRRSVRVGEQPCVAVIVRNLSDKREVVFPLQVVRINNRGQKENGARKDVFIFKEEPLAQGHLYIIPSRDQVVISVFLPAQSVGQYRAEIFLQSTRFIDITEETRGYKTSPILHETIEFSILDTKGRKHQ